MVQNRNIPDLQRGQILRLEQFMERAAIGRVAWSRLRKAANAAGFPLAAKSGTHVMVLVDKYYAYLTHCAEQE